MALDLDLGGAIEGMMVAPRVGAPGKNDLKVKDIFQGLGALIRGKKPEPLGTKQNGKPSGQEGSKEGKASVSSKGPSESTSTDRSQSQIPDSGKNAPTLDLKQAILAGAPLVTPPADSITAPEANQATPILRRVPMPGDVMEVDLPPSVTSPDAGVPLTAMLNPGSAVKSIFDSLKKTGGFTEYFS